MFKQGHSCNIMCMALNESLYLNIILWGGNWPGLAITNECYVPRPKGVVPGAKDTGSTRIASWRFGGRRENPKRQPFQTALISHTPLGMISLPRLKNIPLDAWCYF